MVVMIIIDKQKSYILQIDNSNNSKLYEFYSWGWNCQHPISSECLSEKILPFISVVNLNIKKEISNISDGFLFKDSFNLSLRNSYVFDYEEYNCSFGYANIEKLTCKQSPINIGNLLIKNIRVLSFFHKENRKKVYKLYIGRSNNETSVELDLMEHELPCFFRYPISILNKLFADNIPIQDINMYSIYECVLHESWRYELGFVKGYSYLLEMINECSLERVELLRLGGDYIKYGIRIKMKSAYTYNSYVFALLSKYVSNLLFASDDDSRYYEGIVKDVPEYMIEELKLGPTISIDYRNYIVLKLFAYVILNYNKEKFQEGWKCIKTTINNEKSIPMSFDILLGFYNIFSNIRCWHYIDGEYRVGRDDYEWDEDTFVLPIFNNECIPQDILAKIKDNLSLDLRYEPDKRRYFCQVIGKEEAIGGMAKRRGGELSNSRTVYRILEVLLDCETKLEPKSYVTRGAPLFDREISSF